MRSAITDWPVKYFRPEDVSKEFGQHKDWMRYNERTDSFECDTGESALAFFGHPRMMYGSNAPFALYAEVPSKENILRFAQNPMWCWHYETRDGLPDWGESYEDKELHPNYIAHRKAMDACCNVYSCANGCSVEMIPAIPLEEITEVCAWCKNNGAGHKADELGRRRENNQSGIAQLEDQIETLESRLWDAKEALKNKKIKAEELAKL
jgi:hypothetical protein